MRNGVARIRTPVSWPRTTNDSQATPQPQKITKKQQKQQKNKYKNYYNKKK